MIRFGYCRPSGNKFNWIYEVFRTHLSKGGLKSSVELSHSNNLGIPEFVFLLIVSKPRRILICFVFFCFVFLVVFNMSFSQLLLSRLHHIRRTGLQNFDGFLCLIFPLLSGWKQVVNTESQCCFHHERLTNYHWLIL